MSDGRGALDVRLGDLPVGTLASFPGGTTAFVFDPEYLAAENPPILSLGLLDARGRPRRPRDPPPGRVPPFFANLLPEGDLRRYVARAADLAVTDEFALLAVVGGDLPGAVLCTGDPPPARRGRTAHVHAGPDETLRFSLAGVQLKFSAVVRARGGLTVRAHGDGGSCIVKLPSSAFAELPENEYAMLRFAAAVGIEIPRVRLVPVAHIGGLPAEIPKDGAALVVDRFDRTTEGRTHSEDFAQIFRQFPERKYDDRAFVHVAETIFALLGSAALIDFIERLVFNTAIGNGDMHLKNWSVIFRDPRKPTLAPAYDYVCTRAYLRDDGLGLALASARRFADLSADTFVELAERARLPRTPVLRAVRGAVERVRDVWPLLRSETPERVAAAVDTQLREVPLFARTGV